MEGKVIIIAEAGVNHNGSLELAKKLVDVAAEAGADYVKFQTFKADKLVSREAKKAAYQQANAPSDDDSQYEMLKKLELSESDHHELVKHCASRNIKFLSTAFDEDSVDFLYELGIDIFKVPSGEITNLPYLKKIAEKKLPVILSTGMSTLEEIKDALEVLLGNGIELSMVTVLHCNTEYPTPFEDVNLKAMNRIAEAFKVDVGYSDHTLGIEVPVAAVAMGARIIEKHFTLDRSLPGPDHLASLVPNELCAMVMSIRNIERALAGSGAKEPSKSEQKNRLLGRKSMFYSKSLAAGHVLTENDIIMQRPGDGLSPMLLPSVLGKKLKCQVEKGWKLSYDNITKE